MNIVLSNNGRLHGVERPREQISDGNVTRHIIRVDHETLSDMYETINSLS